ncbi:hypothetical protein ILUMI_16601, partial [Ignelater luminosus]
SYSNYFDIVKETSIDELPSGRRIVDISYVLQEYEQIVLHQTRCTGGKMSFVKGTGQGLLSRLHFKCTNCDKTGILITDSVGDEIKEINESLVWGSISVGIDQQQCEELLSVLNVPSLSAKTYTRYSLPVKNNWQAHLAEKTRQTGEEEKRIALEKDHVTLYNSH